MYKTTAKNKTIPLSLTSISCTYTHCCGVGKQNTVWCYGDNGAGECGSLVPPTVTHARKVGGLPKISNVCVGKSYTCALDIRGGVWCWGQGMFAVLGDRNVPYGKGDFSNEATPLQLQGMDPMNQINCADTHVCAMRRNDSMPFCWGFSNAGQIPGILGVSFFPVGLGVQSSQVVGGGWHTCVWVPDATVRCWGANQYGQAPNQLTSPSPLLGIGSGLYTTYVLGTNRKLYAIGENVLNLPTYSRSPILVSGSLMVSSFSASSTHLCVITTSQQLWCGGQNAGTGWGSTSTLVHT